jgi:diguanylate cyclase (GGDEF)-like protein/PAS domain S-box-containing protein
MPTEIGHLVFALFQNVSLFALVIMAYAGLQRTHALRRPLVDVAMGAVFGLGAVLAMLSHIQSSPGVYVDGRNIMTALAALFGGPITGAVTLVITAGYRISLGGAGMVPGVLGAAITTGIGLLFRRRFRIHGAKPDTGQLLVMGLLVAVSGPAVFWLLNPGTDLDKLIAFSVPLAIVTPLGTALVGLALQYADDRHALAERLQRSDLRMKEAIESVPEGFLLLDGDLRIVNFNRRFLELYPKSAAAVTVGATLEAVILEGARNGEYPEIHGESDAQAFAQQWMRRFRSAEPYFGEGPFGDGRWVVVSHRRTAGGDYVSLRTDITAQKQRERELADLLKELIASQAAEERAHAETRRVSDMLRAITDAAPALISRLDREQRYLYCNKEYRDVFGTDPATLIGRRVEQVVGPEVYAYVQAHIARVLDGQEVEFLRPIMVAGEVRHFEQRYIPELDTEGAVIGFYAMAWDVTERYRREQALDHEALTDPLTGLLNRRAMLRAIENTAPVWSRGGRHGALLFLDVDRFKPINDTYGHDVGDELLRTFAERIRGVVRSSDKVARLGGDEFVILITAPDADEVARRVAETLLKRLREPMRCLQHEIAISTSIGVAVAREPESATQLLKRADLALYQAKAAGRARYAVSEAAAE